MNTVLYARVSTDKQADKELSIPAQLQAMREYAQKHQWTIVEEFLEPGASAKTTEREVLQRLLARIRDGGAAPKIDVVLVHKIDRLARNVYDHATIRTLLTQHEVRLASVVENTDDTVSGQLVENIMASIAQFYSANLAEETKKGMLQLVQRGGWPWKPPRGYALSRDATGRSRVVRDPTVAPTILHAFERYAAGDASLGDLCKDFAQMGIRTPAGRLVSLESVRRLLRNPFYAGWVQWHGARYRGRHEPIITQRLFDRVERMLKARSRDAGEKGKLHFWLRGVAACAECGGRLTAERHGRWAYYRCVRNVYSATECRAPFVNVAVAEHAVAHLLQRLRMSVELKDRVLQEATAMVSARAKDAGRAIRSVRVRQAKLEEQEARLTEAFARGDVSLTAYKATVGKVRARMASCEQALQNAQEDPDRLMKKVRTVSHAAESLWDYHVSLSPKNQTRLLRVVFNRIDLNRTGLINYALTPPFSALMTEDGDRPNARPSGLSTPDLEVTRLRAAIVDIFEFDADALPPRSSDRSEHAA